MVSPFVVHDRTDNRHALLDPVIQGTTNLLTSILHHNVRCRRVVVASDVTAILSAEAGMHSSNKYNELDRNPSTVEDAVRAGGNFAYGGSMTPVERAMWHVLYGRHTPFAECAAWNVAFAGCNTAAVRTAWDVAYVTYNTATERAAWDFMKRHTYPDSISRPGFSLATVCCPMVYGPTVLHARRDTLSESTADIYRLINGSERSVPKTRLHAWVDVRDAAEGHVRVLEAAGKPAGIEDRYLVAAGGYSYTKVCTIIQKWFPHLVNTGLTPNPVGAPLRPPHYPVDNGRSVRELGMAYRPLEECIVDVVHSLLNLHVDKDSNEKKSALVSAPDLHADCEAGRCSLVGSELTVRDGERSLHVCSSSPRTYACDSGARNSSCSPTTQIAQHGLRPRISAVGKGWGEIGDLGVSGLGLEEHSPAACDCDDPATCGKATTGVCFYTTVGGSAYPLSENDKPPRSSSDCGNRSNSAVGPWTSLRLAVDLPVRAASDSGRDLYSVVGASAYPQSENGQPMRAASDCGMSDYSRTRKWDQLTRRGLSQAPAPPLAPVAYIVPEEMSPLTVPDASVLSLSGVAPPAPPVSVTAAATAAATVTTSVAATEVPSGGCAVGGLFAELQRASPFSPTKCCCPRRDTPVGACTCTPAAQDCPCGGHEKNVRECAVPPDEMMCSCACTCMPGEELGGTCSCMPACDKCEHCTERGMVTTSAVLDL